MLNRIRGVALGIGIGLMAVALPALAADPAQLVDERQAEMKKLGGAMKVLSTFVKEGQGTPAELQVAAATIVGVAKIMPGMWHEGTAVGVGDSEALPVIWEKRAEFDKIIADMDKAGVALVVMAASGDAGAVGKGLQGVGATCKACHEGYRLKK